MSDAEEEYGGDLGKFGPKQKGYVYEMFRLFDATNGLEGWDYTRIEASDHPYIVSVMAHDEVVGMWAAKDDGGHSGNEDNKKLFHK